MAFWILSIASYSHPQDTNGNPVQSVIEKQVRGVDVYTKSLSSFPAPYFGRSHCQETGNSGAVKNHEGRSSTHMVQGSGHAIYTMIPRGTESTTRAIVTIVGTLAARGVTCSIPISAGRFPHHRSGFRGCITYLVLDWTIEAIVACKLSAPIALKTLL